MDDRKQFKDLFMLYLRSCPCESERGAYHLTQKDFAGLLGMDYAHFNKVLNEKERGSHDFAQMVVRKLAEKKCITFKQQAKEMLNLWGGPHFRPAQWNSYPLNELLDDPPRMPVASPQAKQPVEKTRLPGDILRGPPSDGGENEPSDGGKNEPRGGVSSPPPDGENTISPPPSQNEGKQSNSHHPFPESLQRRLWMIASAAIVFIAIMIPILILGETYLTKSTHSSTTSSPVATPSPTPVSAAAARSLYHQYTDRPPTHSYDRTRNSSAWVQGAYGNGGCNQTSSGYWQAQSPGEDNFEACIAHDLITASNFALQATLSVEQGEAAGLVFGFTDPASNPSYYNFLICRVNAIDCTTGNAALNYSLPKHAYCFGPDPDANYSAARGCKDTFPAVNASPSVANVLTVIVRGFYVYLYINTTFIGRIDLTPAPSKPQYSTSGQIGFCAYGSSQMTDVTMQSFKVWT